LFLLKKTIKGQVLVHTLGLLQALDTSTADFNQAPSYDVILIIIMTFYGPISSKINLSGATKPRD